MLTHEQPHADVADLPGSTVARTHEANPTPLLPVLAFSFLNSIGSAVVYSGIYSLAKFQYGFERLDNYLLALLYGLAYIPAALGVGKFLAFLDRSGRVSHRTVLALIVLAMACICVLPPLVHRLEGDGSHSSWPLWVVCAIYSPLSGAMWPMAEAYVSGGRRGESLRRAIGRFNIAWSSALVVTLVGISNLVERHPLEVLAGLSGVHLVTALCLLGFRPRPGEHAHAPALPADGVVATHVQCPHCQYDLYGAQVAASCPECGCLVSDAFHLNHPAVYKRLLIVLQFLLPVAFLGISTISPYLTGAFKILGVRGQWETAVIAVWMTARVITFAVMERYHGWHGRWWIPITGTTILLTALATVVLAPVLFPAGPGFWILVAGLVGFGVGVGMIYAASLYYTMEVGAAEVSAGGMFETLIGIGYALGPLCGLAGAASIRWAGASDAAGNGLTLALVALLALGGVALALRRARAAS